MGKVTRLDDGDDDLQESLTLTLIVKEDGKKPKRSQISSNSYHSLLEAIFTGAKSEAAYYAKSTKSTAAKAESRLSAFASLLRAVVETNVRKLSQKTVGAVIEHICQTLPTNDGSYCFPLLFDYMRGLAHLLQYKAHIENLSREGLQVVLSFCLALAQDASKSQVQSSDNASEEHRSNSNLTRLSFRLSQAPTSSVNARQSRSSGSHESQLLVFPQLQSSVASTLMCLQHLTSISGLPISNEAEEIVNVVFELLHYHSTVGTTLQPAFETFNSLIPLLLTSNTKLGLFATKRIIPHVRTLWQTRSHSLKEVLLSILLHAECIMHALVTEDEDLNTRTDILALVEILRQEYCERRAKEQLLIDDIDLSDYVLKHESDSRLTFKLASIEMGKIRAEEPWAVLHVSSSLVVALQHNIRSAWISSSPAGGYSQHTKRQRLEEPLDELFWYLTAGTASQIVYALQMFAVIFDMHEYDSRDLHRYLESLLARLSDDDITIVSWAMFAIACSSNQGCAYAESLREVWCRIWRVAVRHLTSSATSRVSCHLSAVLLDLGLVEYSDVADIIDNLLSAAELNGPAECDGAATKFWQVILSIRGQENVSSFSDTSNMILLWLFKRWNLVADDRNRKADGSNGSSASSVVGLISTCLGLPFVSPRDRQDCNVGRLLQSRFQSLKYQPLVRYLILSEGAIDKIEKPRTPFKSFHPEQLSTKITSRSLTSRTLEFITAEASRFLQTLFSEDNASANRVTPESVHVCVSLCIVGYSMLSSQAHNNDERSDGLRKALDRLKQGLLSCIEHHERRTDLLDGLICSFWEFTWPIAQLIHGNDVLRDGVIAMSKNMGPDFWQSFMDGAQSLNGAGFDDPMDIDVDFSEQSQQERHIDITSDLMHDLSVAKMGKDSFKVSTVARICLMSLLWSLNDSGSESESNVGSLFVNYLTGLRKQDFVSCQEILHGFLRSNISLSEDDADTILQYLSQTYTEKYETRRSEVAICICLYSLTDLVEMWTLDGSDCAGAGAELYQWLKTHILNGAPASAHVYISAANMFEAVVKTRSDYTKTLSLPSARTSLFDMLKHGDLIVKFNIGQTLSNIFSLFVLKEHDHILEDIIKSLPNDADWLEGIALRLFVLARLASSWPTLLRRCVYAIFETPGHVSLSTEHAKCCINFVAKSLGLSQCQDLFKLFVSQILYTWLETQELEAIPYSIFGYQNLIEMLQEAQAEVCGQLIMRGKDIAAEKLAMDLNISLQALLETNFSKVAAYSIARDVAFPTPKSENSPGTESRLRKILGKDRYAQLVVQNFADTMAHFFTHMDFEEHIDRAFQKRPAFLFARTAYQEMLQNGASNTILPPNQQPSFKAKYLLDQVEFWCRRTSHAADRIWRPTLYIHVLRKTLQMVHPAFGSLHTCSVVRKVRILVSLAGSTALSGYSLEMALHALSPLLTDPQCADDACGITRFLFDHGRTYLASVPSFLTGNAASMLISLRTFFDSTQDSTTQETQFRATIASTRSFHGWLAAYLSRYTSENMSTEAVDSLRRIVKAASNFQNHSNARIGTHESDMLLELLEDERSGRNLLDQSSRDSILQILCTSFETSPHFREDVLGQEFLASRYASLLWETCQRGIGNTNYLIWCGKALGRAYAGTGQINGEMIREAPNLCNQDAESRQSLFTGSFSRAKVLQLTCNLLQSRDQREVGMAEAILQSVVTRAQRSDLFEDCEQVLRSSLMEAMLWTDFDVPKSIVEESSSDGESISSIASNPALGNNPSEWIQNLIKELRENAREDPILDVLPSLLRRTKTLAEQIFPYVLHLILLQDLDGHQGANQIVSDRYAALFDLLLETGQEVPLMRILLNALLYLHTQALPRENVRADRVNWLKIDYHRAALVASKCSMYKTALLLLETASSQRNRTEALSRRSSSHRQSETRHEALDVLLEIYQNLDDLDAFHGIQVPSSLASMMERLEYEQASFKSISFRGAFYDSQIRQFSDISQIDGEGMLRVLGKLDLNGLSQALLGQKIKTGPRSTDVALETARKLEKWDVSAPSVHKSAANVNFRIFQSLNSATDLSKIEKSISEGFAELMQNLLSGRVAKHSVISSVTGLAVLAEIDEVFSSHGYDQIEEVISRFETRREWMQLQRFERVHPILSCRETAFSSLSKREPLRGVLRLSQKEVYSLEARAFLMSAQLSRDHGALQNALTAVTNLNYLVKPSLESGIEISSAVQFASANVFWDQGEMDASIRMLQDVRSAASTKTQLFAPSKEILLTKLGRQVAEARLEKPDEIIKSYLIPAIKAVDSTSEGSEASEVFHEFAFFCDQQLQNPDSLEDFHRIQRLRDRKQAEVQDLEAMLSKAPAHGKERDSVKNYRNKAKLWFDLDDREYQRHLVSRQVFLKQSLENYLLCLRASDKFDNDAVRFSALWLENHDSDIANAAVSKHIGQVGSRKFAALINQWTSRLLAKTSTFQTAFQSAFQTVLVTLVLRICIEHPYHGMYQIFASSKSKGSKDEASLARFNAANLIGDKLKANKHSSATWLALHITNVSFVKFASDKLDPSTNKQGSKILLKQIPTAQRLEQDASKHQVPPPTMTIPLRADRDYSSVPYIKRFQPEFTIASGNSAPKIVTAIGSDGQKYKQLFKGGNDDLRQDAIMEQVFSAVSSLLGTQRTTRQRSLKIRTYKVLPLTATAGIIEFVPNTIPLHDYLMPAHQRHYPRDLKPTICRRHIADAQSSSVENRIKIFKKVAAQFHPVLRHFFFERFESPDTWYETRLAYTRSTAAISILGHVLGLGDRHGHNILLDETTGEVVHIDLGIAFEQGRVLPVPEVVSFRLTRDLVDAMGITGTEGVFRRCCEFTLEALRNESYSIMTILDVLRYDPLYSWSLSPLRMQRLQKQAEEGTNNNNNNGGAAGGGNDGADANGDGCGRGGEEADDPGEADRALTVVKKKLSKSLSVQATVNELIQTATDERNLAVLFCGWAAYA